MNSFTAQHQELSQLIHFLPGPERAVGYSCKAQAEKELDIHCLPGL